MKIFNIKKTHPTTDELIPNESSELVKQLIQYNLTATHQLTPKEFLKIYRNVLSTAKLQKLYAGVYFSKVEVVINPMFIYNIDEDKVINDDRRFPLGEPYEMITNAEGKGELRYKLGNRRVYINTYCGLDLNFINACRKIIIYNNKNIPEGYYRYIPVEYIYNPELNPTKNIT
jgi:hypothetical protein